jgi:hypothetical protein
MNANISFNNKIVQTTPGYSVWRYQSLKLKFADKYAEYRAKPLSVLLHLQGNAEEYLKGNESEDAKQRKELLDFVIEEKQDKKIEKDITESILNV